MIENAPGIERLRRAFSTYEDPEVEAEEIDAERIYRAAAGELPEDERRAVIDQVATSAAAGEVWRLAIELQRAEAKAAQETEEESFAPEVILTQPVGEVVPFRRPVPAPIPVFRRRFLTAIAALLAATIGFGLWTRMHAPAPTLRGAGSALSTTIEDGARLPRGAFRLAWTPSAEPGTRYTVRVTTEDLRPVAEARRLETASYQVPEAALAALPAGTRLLWLVEARTTDGRTIASPAYEVEIAR
ncbi:MAG TPA: hypothetical protein VGS22_03815 [Thermoanaerobaculia bacterium]|jgi:hypothetical protein|nr:hypothetical protein [Thermoanaerobaculia bacterium]